MRATLQQIQAVTGGMRTGIYDVRFEKIRRIFRIVSELAPRQANRHFSTRWFFVVNNKNKATFGCEH